MEGEKGKHICTKKKLGKSSSQIALSSFFLML